MKNLTKIAAIGSLVFMGYAIVNEVCLTYRREIRKAYQKGRTDCVDDFVRGFAFTNNRTVTIESEHNGSITVKTIG